MSDDDTVLSFGKTRVRISHRELHHPPVCPSNALLLRAESCELDTLTTLRIGRLGSEYEILVLWSSNGSTFGFNLRYEESTGVLFIGAGTLSAVIHVSTLNIIDENIVDLFWDFVPCREFVLEQGELECRLYRKDGTCIGAVPVDPPYEWREKKTGLVFSSSIFGEQRIDFPTD